MRIAIVIAGALIAYAINPELWRDFDSVYAFGFLFICLILFALDLTDFGRGGDA